jgi:hypothetical protein
MAANQTSTPATAPATAQEIAEVIGKQDELLIAQILRTGASREEVLQAHTWLNADDALGKSLGRPMRGGAAKVLEILEAAQLDSDEAF